MFLSCPLSVNSPSVAKAPSFPYLISHIVGSPTLAGLSRDIPLEYTHYSARPSRLPYAQSEYTPAYAALLYWAFPPTLASPISSP